MKIGLPLNIHKYLEGEIITSESSYVLKPMYLHLHENDISEQLHEYHLMEYLYRFIESIPDLKDELDYLVCCFSFENKSFTSPTNCKRDRFYQFRFTDFKWKDFESFTKKYSLFKRRPEIFDFANETNGLIKSLEGVDLLQPYILREKNKSVDPIFTIITKPTNKTIEDLLKQYQTGNSYQSAWYGYKFKTDKAKYWSTGKTGNERKLILNVGFISHVIQWNYELKSAHEKSKTIKQLKFSELMNIAAHTFKTNIYADFISEIESIQKSKKFELKDLAKLEGNAKHLFSLTGIINLLTKVKNKNSFRETALKDGLFTLSATDWLVKNKIDEFSTGLFRRKGYKIKVLENKDISPPILKVHGLYFSESLIKSFFNTLLENIESHGKFENINGEEICHVEITRVNKTWTFKNKAKKIFEVESNKLTGNIFLYKWIIEETFSGELNIDCIMENSEIYFYLTIKTK